MTVNFDPLNAADMSELLDLSSLPEAQRVAFYGAMLAIAAADGSWGWDELDLIFQNIHLEGLTERNRHTIWEYLIEPPPLTDCLSSFATGREDVRCAVMVYLIAVALVDRTLAAGEDEALLEARTRLRINQRQIEAIERYICDVGLVRARPRDYHTGAPSLTYQYGRWLGAGVGLCAIALFLSSLIGGISLPETVSEFARPAVRRALLLGAGATALIGTAAFATGRWLHARYQRSRRSITCERRQRARACVSNLRDAVSYLSVKARLHAVVGDPNELGTHTSLLLVERLWTLQQMLARRQPNTPTTALPPEVPRLSSR